MMFVSLKKQWFKLMHDFNCADPNEMYFELFRNTTRYYKETQEGVTSMCKAFEEVKNEAREEMRLDFAKKLLAYGKMTLEEISQMTDMSVNDLRKLQEAGA